MFQNRGELVFEDSIKTEIVWGTKARMKWLF